MGNGDAEDDGLSSATSSLAQRPAERPSVLIVDDTPANLLAFSSVLAGEGYEILTAKSGPEALKLVLRREFAVILLDVRMPGMDGIETATFLRAGRGRYTPIIFISAHDNTPHEVERGYLAGAIDYLFSPVDPDLLKRKVAALVDFYLRTLEFKRRSDSLLQANQILLRKVASLEETVAELRGGMPRGTDAPAAR
ncbi:MAG TPA: response regulator [Planctomycetota bacterium]|nr:response regulator [Planctomycetota bacterium]